MIDRLILSAMLGTVGFNGMFPEPKPIPTLKQKAVYKSMSAICERKGKQTKTVKQMCDRWREQQNA